MSKKSGFHQPLFLAPLKTSTWFDRQLNRNGAESLVTLVLVASNPLSEDAIKSGLAYAFRCLLLDSAFS